MKVVLVCVECENMETFELDLLKEKELGIQRFTCPNGHKNAVILLNRQYDIAFETGLERIKEKKYKEAMQELDIALSKYYEFAIKMICSLNSVPFEVYERSWKNVDSSLEGRIGAYIALFTLAFRQHAEVLPDELKKLRDNIILRSYNPSYGEVVGYAQKVHKIIKAGIEKIRQCEYIITSENDPDNLAISYVAKKMSDLTKTINLAKENASFQSLPTALFYGAAEHHDFDELIREDVIIKS